MRNSYAISDRFYTENGCFACEHKIRSFTIEKKTYQ